MSFKKITALLLSLAFIAAISAGCSDNKTPAGDNETPEVSDSGEQGGETATPSVSSSNYDMKNFSYSDYLDTNGYFDGVKASDFVSLPEYKGITLPEDVLVPNEDDVQAQIDEILAQHAEYEQITDRALADGDTVNIDYVGSVDGVEFEGGNTQGAGTVVTIGVTNYIDDFLQQLIGHMPGENFDIEVTFPEDYGKEDLNGKDAIFNVTINHIQGEAKEITLTDEIAKEYDFENVDALLEDIRTWLVEQQKSDFATDTLSNAMLVGSVPQSVLDYVICTDLAYYQGYADMFGTDLDSFISSYVGYENTDAYISDNMTTYTQNSIYYLAIQALAEKEGLIADDMAVSDAGLSDYVEQYGMPYLKQYVLQTIIVPAFLIENAAKG